MSVITRFHRSFPVGNLVSHFIYPAFELYDLFYSYSDVLLPVKAVQFYVHVNVTPIFVLPGYFLREIGRSVKGS